jgi:hypothetical protein
LYSFKEIFKLEPTVVDVVFETILKNYRCLAKHLLWSLYYLKTKNSNEAEIAVFLRTNRKTLRIHVIETLTKLVSSLPNVWLNLFARICLINQLV